MATEVLDRKSAITTLACQYAGGIVAALSTVEDEAQLYEGLAGAFLAFLEEAEDLCLLRTGTPGG